MSADAAPMPQRQRVAYTIALALGSFGIGTTEFVAMGILRPIAESFNITEPQAGHIISIYALGVVVGAPLITIAAAKIGRKLLLMVLMGMFGLANIATSLAPSYELLLLGRFFTGVPHGAYFGVAAVAAAHLAPQGAKATAMARVMLGLTVAGLIGVPFASWLAHMISWRASFGFAAVIGLLTVIGLALFLPALRDYPHSSAAGELKAVWRQQIWLTLAIGTFGFGGMFAVYSYINWTMVEVAGLNPEYMWVVLMIYGAGMVAGNLIGGRLADRSINGSIALGSIILICSMSLFIAAAHHPVTALLVLPISPIAASIIVPALQMRLLTYSQDAPALAASLMHSALNTANALGAWLGGLVIAAGYGYTAPSAVGAMLAVLGLSVLLIAVRSQHGSFPSLHLVRRRLFPAGSIRDIT